MFEFFKSLFNPAPPSGATAKERLRLVLLSDHLSLAPDVMEAMKRDLLEVLSRYVEIDMAHADVTFEQRDSEVAMLASVPITGVRERKAAMAAVAAVPIELPVVETPVPDAPAAEAPPVLEEDEDARVPVAADAAPSRSANARPPRRRRRKKAAPGNAQPGQPKLGPPGIAASQA